MSKWLRLPSESPVGVKEINRETEDGLESM